MGAFYQIKFKFTQIITHIYHGKSAGILLILLGQTLVISLTPTMKTLLNYPELTKKHFSEQVWTAGFESQIFFSEKLKNLNKHTHRKKIE